MENYRVVQIGCGKMSAYTMRYVMEDGCELVGAIDRDSDLVGEDISKVIGGDYQDVEITDWDDAEDLLRRVKPDICIITTMSLMKDIIEPMLLCASLGINAITTCEEAFYPFNSSPAIVRKIDELAKAHNCTITGSGYQDCFWGNLIAVLAGATHTINKIAGSSSYNVEDYGIALAKVHGVGLSKEQFEEQIAAADNISEKERQESIDSGTFLPSYMWNTNGWLCDKFGLHVKHQTQKCVPIFSKHDIVSSTLGMKIKSGHCIGMSAKVHTETKEGITIDSECVGKVYDKDDVDRNEWTIHGEPDTTVVITRPATVELTCATIVNRISDVMKARSGFVPTSKMGELKFQK